MPLPGIDPTTKRFTEAVGGAGADVAATGTVIGNAAALSYGFQNVTGADDTKGVVLPAAYPGASCEVYSVQATNGLKIYPPVNSAVNGGSANAAVVIEGKTLAVFRGTNSSNWAAIFTTNT